MMVSNAFDEIIDFLAGHNPERIINFHPSGSNQERVELLLEKKRENPHGICEYCLAFEGYSYVKFQIDHIISLKHGGLTEPENLALSCFICNNKGTDIGTIIRENTFVRLFNPRKDNWKDHFELSDKLHPTEN